MTLAINDNLRSAMVSIVIPFDRAITDFKGFDVVSQTQTLNPKINQSNSRNPASDTGLIRAPCTLQNWCKRSVLVNTYN